MRRLLSRTSITIDEAVYILLGRSTGPIDYEPMVDSEEAEANCPVFCLQEALEDEPDQENLVGQADVYRCEIYDELNKGEQSVLKVDRALSNAVYTFITRHSFNEWVKCRDVAGEQRGGAEGADADRESVKKVKKPGDKGIRQKDAIIAELERRRVDPRNLPRNPPGKGDVKEKVRDAIAKPPLFPSYKVFDDQWQALRNEKRIADEARPSSPQKVDGGDL